MEQKTLQKLVEMYESTSDNKYQFVDYKTFFIICECYDHENNRGVYVIHDNENNKAYCCIIDGTRDEITGELLIDIFEKEVQ